MSVKWNCDSCGGESDEQMPKLKLNALEVEFEVDLCLMCITIFRQRADSLLDDMLVTIQEEAIEVRDQEPDPEET